VQTALADTGLALIAEHFSRQADDVDAGRRDVRDGLRWLGDHGFLRPADDAGGRTPLPYLVTLVRALANSSLAAAFSVWSQSMVLEYLTFSPATSETGPLVEDLRTGRLLGATALAPAIAALAGAAPLPVTALPSDDGFRLDGSIGWATNLFDDAVVVTPARTAEGAGIVALFRLGSPGAQVAPAAPLLALNGTGSSSIRLTGVPVTGAAVLSRDLAGFLAGCRPTMLLLQTAMAMGLADASLTATGAGVTADSPLRPDHADLADRQRRVSRTMSGYAAEPSTAAPGALARLRVDAMSVAQDAVTLELAVAGGRAYRADSATSRRVREAAFLPVQAPTLQQLRREIARTAGA
jgi:alkylation response protein AidB-like acyl-CoA dehydrogenase